MKLKKLIPIIMTSLILPTIVFGLQQTVGKLEIYVKPGESNSSYYGLINEGNQTITVKLRTEGLISEFVNISKELELQPKKFVPVFVNVSIPSNYDFSKGNNITGYVYALIEGKPGQVQINVQARKTVDIIVQGEKSPSTESKLLESHASGITGLLSTPVSIPFFVAFLITIVVLLGLFFFVKSKKEVK